jgi:signal transduction histidine kinase
MSIPDRGASAPSTASVLAVDDVAANLFALAAVLEPVGCRVVEARSGAEALALAAREEFAAILLDVAMPEMDGFETLTRLRAIPLARETPVVLVTAYTLDPIAMGRVGGMGSVDYILKPIPPELLRSKVAALVALHLRGKELRVLSEALAAKDRSIAMLAHDLQNPLSSIGTSAAMLQRACPDPRSQRAAERISRGVARMSGMIRDLTDYARAGRGTLPTTPAPMDVGELCRELADDFQQSDSAQRIDVVCAGSLAGEWDRARLHQALSNLLGNAFRYGAGGVVVRAEGADAYVQVSVHNTGAPIPTDVLPVIFEPFERGTQDRSGLGLGLYIVREIAKAHQGDVSVASTAERGTTFTIRLPRRRNGETA